MKTLIFALLLSHTAHATMVVSDVDDTIKISQSGDLIQGAWNGLFTKNVFPGMPEVFRGWARSGFTLHFVSASPSMLYSKISQLLKHHNIPVASLTLRSNILEAKLSYKVKSISRLLNKSPEEDVVLIGDDVGQDPEVFAAIKEKFPGRVSAVYIRPVKARSALDSQIPYVTAFDVVTIEALSGRIDEMAQTEVTEAVLTGSPKKLLPTFSWCPEEIDGTALPTDSSTLTKAEEIETRIETICRER